MTDALIGARPATGTVDSLPAGADVRWYAGLSMADVDVVGGKNASLGEMISSLVSAGNGVRVPDGFATTAGAFRRFLARDGLDARIAAEMEGLDVEDLTQLVQVGERVRAAIVAQPFPEDLEVEVRAAYEQLVGADAEASVAVRSSATAEDLPDASFAGQQETFLNVRGIESVLLAVREVFASLYNDRAIAYRTHQGFAHIPVAISAGVQRMVRSDLGASGVVFTVDTESGFEDVVFITSSYGLGEAVVGGAVNPDEFYVSKVALRAGRAAILKRQVGAKAIKMEYTDDTRVGRSTEFVDVPVAERGLFSLDDADVSELARIAMSIEAHYGCPMDIEWGKDGRDGLLYVLQARPETVTSRRTAGTVQRYTVAGVTGDDTDTVLVEGRAIGQRAGAGRVRVMTSVADMASFAPGDVLVADMTDPDWEPIMKLAAAIVTNRGGRTCHAAIVARELGVPAVVGTGDATDRLTEGREVTVTCAVGDTGYVYDGLRDIAIETTEVGSMPAVPVKMMMNVANPEQAFAFSRLPHAGVGLARMEFIVNRQIGVHPRALLDLHERPEVLEGGMRERIGAKIVAYASPRDFFVRRVAEGVAMIAAAFAPEPVIVRLSDFKSNEYANLLGGEVYEPVEENPMLGYRGAARYLSPDFADCFAMECEALRYVREEMGFTNVQLMVPFVRTVDEMRGVIELLATHGLRRGENGLRVVMMCELPSNALLAGDFLEHVDGFSIGSNDLTQLTLGLDRDSALAAASFDERDPAVKALISMAIRACRDRGKYVGICGQGPSDHPDFAQWLVEQGIESLSLNPDTVVETWTRLAADAVLGQR